MPHHEYFRTTTVSDSIALLRQLCLYLSSGFSGGIITDSDNCGNAMTHAILAVGYDYTWETPYILLKNQVCVWWCGGESDILTLPAGLLLS
jgi:hypothetical protein